MAVKSKKSSTNGDLAALAAQAESKPRLGVTQRKFAELLNVSEAYVSKLVADGRIHLNAHGRIDPDMAREEIEATRDPAAAFRSKTSPDPQAAQYMQAYMQARSLKMAYQAKREQLEYEQEAGRLIGREEVGAALFAVARSTRDRILQVPERLANELASERSPRKVAKLLGAALEEALEGLLTAEVGNDN